MVEDKPLVMFLSVSDVNIIHGGSQAFSHAFICLILTLTGMEGHICPSLVKGLEGHICPSVVTSWWHHCDVI